MSVQSVTLQTQICTLHKAHAASIGRGCSDADVCAHTIHPLAHFRMSTDTQRLMIASDIASTILADDQQVVFGEDVSHLKAWYNERHGQALSERVRES